MDVSPPEWESELPWLGAGGEAEMGALLLALEPSREVWLLCGAGLGRKGLLLLEGQEVTDPGQAVIVTRAQEP